MARRRYQHGWVRRVGDSWFGYWREDEQLMDGTTFRRTVCRPLGRYPDVPTKRTAERLLAPLVRHVNGSDYRPTMAVTFGQFVEAWSDKVLPLLKPSSQAAMKSHLKVWLIPAFGKLLLPMLDQEAVQSFVSTTAGRVSRKSLANILATLSSVLNAARRWGYHAAEGVSVKYLTLPALKPKRKARVLTPDEFRRILSAAEEPYRTMYAIAGFAMLRAGEIMGLRWEDIDFERNVIHIRQSGWYGQIVAPKTANSEATVPLPSTLKAYLKNYGAALVEMAIDGVTRTSRDRAITNGSAPDTIQAPVVAAPSRFCPTQKEGLLFPRTDNLNSPMTANWVVQKKLKPLLSLLGISPCGFHAFRHMGATLLANDGAATKSIQGLLRHADVRTTMNVYAHLDEAVQRTTSSRLSEILLHSATKTDDKPKFIQ